MEKEGELSTIDVCPER